MRIWKLSVTALAALVIALGPAAPARADGVTVQLPSVTYVPSYTPPVEPMHQDLQVSSGVDGGTITITTNAPGGFVIVNPSSFGYTCDQSGGSATCGLVSAPGGQTVKITLSYSGYALNKAVGSGSPKDYQTTVTVSGTGQTATGYVHVRPSADRMVGSIGVRGLSSTSFEYEFNIINQGPSGGTMIATVTGFRSRAQQALPSACTWSAALTVKCTYTGSITENVSTVANLPMLASDRGCRFTVAVSGTVPDPKSSNNVKSSTGSGPCGSTTTNSSPSPSSTSGGTAGGQSSRGAATPTATATPTAGIRPSSGAAGDPASPGPGASPLAATQSEMALAAAGPISPPAGGHGVLWAGLAGGLLIALGAAGGFWMIRRRASTPREVDPA